MPKNERVDRIREAERTYHESCYDQHKLFEFGSWLHKPVRTVMETLNYFYDYNDLSVLDLGCGVGRNSIPIAETLKQRDGKVVCVDILESAIHKLIGYNEQFKVRNYMEPRIADIGNYDIAEDAFDYIVAVSTLEHIDSLTKLDEVLLRMNHGTKDRGMNCIIMNTNITELDRDTGQELEPQMEINMSTNQAKQLLAEAYRGWQIIEYNTKPLKFDIERNGRDVILSSDCITYVVRKQVNA